MNWERVRARSESRKFMKMEGRWGHTCNIVNGVVYVFGGFTMDKGQTNDVLIYDPNSRTWSNPILTGKPPTPRDSHSCATVGKRLFVFGGTDGHKHLRDLVILDTATNAWIEPEVHGEHPTAREGHSVAFLGHHIFIFGGCGKTEDGEDMYHNDLYILDTINYFWMKAATSGITPSPRENHTCSVWNNKLIVVGGQDASDSYFSDVYVLDGDTLVWKQLKTTGQRLTARAGHSTVLLGKHLFVFGGYNDDCHIYEDLHILNIESGVWTKAVTTGRGPSARFSVAGVCLDAKRGILAFFGGCNPDLDTLHDLYYLHWH